MMYELLIRRREGLRLIGRLLAGIACCWPGIVAAQATNKAAQYPELLSETPDQFQPTQDRYDFERRKVMIPMRDGVKLHTVILIPRGIEHAPILLTRTPYDANRLTEHHPSAHLSSVLQGYDNATDVIVEGRYIRVVQDIRGKYHSEGDYVMNRPLHGPQNPTPVDHATDTYDTVDWLVKNVPETNGKVGLLGISYDGFLALMGAVDAHPALKVSVPMNPMVDGWQGDDWFHHGAFRQQMMPYIYEQQATRAKDEEWHTSHFDDYDLFLQATSAGALGQRRGLNQLGFWRKVVEHPQYDSFWRDQAVDRIFATRPPQIPMMLVHSLWDQEDIYGAPAVYRAIEPQDTRNDRVYFVAGPWHHGQMIGDGQSLGALKYPTDTARSFRQEILRPFLDHYLQDNPPPLTVAPVNIYETGSNRWRKASAWPATKDGPAVAAKRLYLRAQAELRFEAPAANEPPFTEYVSDPAKPVPYRQRPIQRVGYGDHNTWSAWLVDDQREASGRTDVVTFTSDVLTEPLRVAGLPIAHLLASTSGSDSDWVIKLIDVYPDEVSAQPEMGGYQLMVAADILRGRYRQDAAEPRPLTPNEPLEYQWELPLVSHEFQPGHRIMVQVQSSWFPLYDRNPQKFVSNIFWAQPEDYQQATQRVWHTPQHASYVDLPQLSGNDQP